MEEKVKDTAEFLKSLSKLQQQFPDYADLIPILMKGALQKQPLPLALPEQTERKSINENDL